MAIGRAVDAVGKTGHGRVGSGHQQAAFDGLFARDQTGGGLGRLLGPLGTQGRVGLTEQRGREVDAGDGGHEGEGEHRCPQAPADRGRTVGGSHSAVVALEIRGGHGVLPTGPDRQ